MFGGQKCSGVHFLGGAKMEQSACVMGNGGPPLTYTIYNIPIKVEKDNSNRTNKKSVSCLVS